MHTTKVKVWVCVVFFCLINGWQLLGSWGTHDWRHFFLGEEDEPMREWAATAFTLDAGSYAGGAWHDAYNYGYLSGYHYFSYADDDGTTDFYKTNDVTGASTKVYNSGIIYTAGMGWARRLRLANGYLCGFWISDASGAGLKYDIRYAYSNDGAAWTPGTIAGSAVAGFVRRVIDFVYADSNYYILYSENNGAGSIRIIAQEIITGAGTITANITSEEGVWGGRLTAVNTYKMILNTAAGVYTFYTFTGAAFTAGAAVSLTLTTLFPPWQYYYEYGDLRFITTDTYLYFYDFSTATYGSAAQTFSSEMIAVIWDTDITVKYLLFYQSLYKPLPSGCGWVKILSSLTAGGSGFADTYFGLATGYTIELTAITVKDAVVDTALYMAPTAAYVSLTEPFEEQFVEWYEDAMSVDTSILTEFDASLTGWTDGDGANCASIYLASLAGSNYTITNCLKQTDNSNVALCDVYKTIPTTTTHISAWLAIDTTAAEAMMIRVMNAASTTAIQVMLYNGKIYYYDVHVSTDSGVSVAVNTWVHICIADINYTTDKYTLYVNGLLIASGIDFYDVVADIGLLHFNTSTASPTIPYIGYAACPYYGASLAEAFASYWVYQDTRLLFNGFVDSYTTDGINYSVICIDPVDIDFRTVVSETYAAQTAHAILKDIIDTYCHFLYYTTHISTTPASTYDVTFTDITIAEIIRWCDTVESYQTSVRPDGEVYWDTYVEVGHAIDDGSQLNGRPLKSVDKRRFGKFILYGALDATTGEQLYSPLQYSTKFDTYIDEMPQISVQADLDAAVAKIAAQKNLTINKIAFTKYRMPVIYCGEEAIITNSFLSISGAVWYCLAMRYSDSTHLYTLTLSDAFWQPPTFIESKLVRHRTGRNRGLIW